MGRSNFKKKRKSPLPSEWKERADAFYAYVGRHGKDCKKKRLISRYAHHVGISPRILKEYLASFIDIDAIQPYGDYILTAEDYYGLTEEDFNRLRELSGGGKT